MWKEEEEEGKCMLLPTCPRQYCKPIFIVFSHVYANLTSVYWLVGLPVGWSLSWLIGPSHFDLSVLMGNVCITTSTQLLGLV